MCAKLRKSWDCTLFVCLFIGTLLVNSSHGSGIGLGLHGGIIHFMSDVTPPDFGYLGEASIEVPLSQNFSTMLVGGLGQQKFDPVGGSFTTQLYTLDLRGVIRLPVTSFLCPMFYIGAGAVNFQRGDLPRYWDGVGIAGAGMELKLGKRIGLSLTADYRYTSGDDFDGVVAGGSDAYVTAKGGIHYHFPDKEQEEDQPLAAKVLKLGQQQEAEEEFLSELVAADEKGELEAGITPGISTSDSDLTNRINLLNEILNDRESAIAQMRAEIVATDERIASLEMELKGKSPGAPDLSLYEDFKSQYDFGIERFNEKVFTEAASIFQSLIEKDPTNKLASNCQYWIGECEYASKNFDRAIEAFERTLEYENTPKGDDAMLMLGLSYKRLSQQELAQHYFQKLLDEYPDSEYTEVARKNLGVNHNY